MGISLSPAKSYGTTSLPPAFSGSAPAANSSTSPGTSAAGSISTSLTP